MADHGDGATAPRASSGAERLERLIDEGRYEGDHAYLTLREPAPRTPGEPCVHDVYRDATAIPSEALRRIGRG